MDSSSDRSKRDRETDKNFALDKEILSNSNFYLLNVKNKSHNYLKMYSWFYCKYTKR